MSKGGHQLAYDERCQIRVLMSRGVSMFEIARGLGRSPEQIAGRYQDSGYIVPAWI